MSFVHLHVHSCYSLLDGAIKIEDLTRTAKKMGMPAVALTDHGQMFGILEFYKSALKAGVKPILGVETYVAAAGRHSRSTPDLQHHLVLLAENMEGYRNLCRLISLANIEGFYYKPRVDKELLAAHSQGLIALSGCLKGEVPWWLLNRGPAEAARSAEEYAAIFPGRFYLELQANGLAEQAELNAGLIDLGRSLGLPLAATNDCHYLAKEDAELHDVLLCVETGRTKDDPKRVRFETDEFYFKPPSEMAAAFKDLPEALANTLVIAERCQVEFPEKPKFAFPALKLEEGQTAAEVLEKEARRGLERRFEAEAEAGRGFDQAKKEAYQARLEEEITLIIKMEFPDYFLIVADFIDWAKSRQIPVGPGRGSAAGSLVAWALGITDIDPIRFDLLFERFLNPERRTMPDIDVDFCGDRRDEVIAYVTEKYGGQREVAQIITFGRMKARGVIRDVARVMDWSPKEADSLAKLVPVKLKDAKGDLLEVTLDRALEAEPQLARAAETDPRTGVLLTYARYLENMPRHAGTHAAGVVIGDRPLSDLLPLARAKEEKGEKTQIVTQFEMKGVEDIGLVKFDFLGLKTLTIINHCLEVLKKNGVEVDFQSHNFDDGPTYALLARGDSSGVFQLESSGIREYLVKLKPACLEDLMALVALYRPGPLQSGLADQFIQIRRGQRKAVYDLPQLEPILKETGGVILYQEQVIRLSQVLANFTLGQADLLRRAMGKKNPEEMARQKDSFMAGARAGGIEEAKASHIFELMAHFADYGFNKSHSAAYAVLTYRTAYLKANHPLEFMAALLSAEKKNQDKLEQLIGEIRAAGLEVLPPDVNESGAQFTVVNGAIRFGLGAVKGLGEAAIDSIIEARNEGGPFTSLFNFCERADTQKVNSRALGALVKCGAFDRSGGADRAIMFLAIDDALEAGARRQRDRREGQANLFDLLSARDPAPAALKWPRGQPWPDHVRLNNEKEALGFFITGHPLAGYEKELGSLVTTTIGRVQTLADRSRVRLGGLITGLKTKKSKRGNEYAHLTLADQTGSVEVLVLDISILEKYRAGAAENEQSPMVVTGILEAEVKSEEGERGSAVKVIAQEILPLTEALEKKTASLTLRLPRGGLDRDALAFLSEAARDFRGSAGFYLHLAEPEGVAVYRLTATLRPCRELAERLGRRFGPGRLEHQTML